MADFNWQPIATAPRDGTRILARAKNAGGAWMKPYVAYWSDDTWIDGEDEDGHPCSIDAPLEWVAVKWQEPQKYYTWDKSELFKS